MTVTAEAGKQSQERLHWGDGAGENPCPSDPLEGKGMSRGKFHEKGRVRIRRPGEDPA